MTLRESVLPAASPAPPPLRAQALQVLVVDDEAAQRRIVAEILESAGYQSDTASSIEDAQKRLGEGRIDLVLSDLKMPGGSGMELLEKIKASAPEVEVILMTAFSSIETAVEAMRKGAFHYLPKPFSRETLLGTVTQAAETIRLRRENARLRGMVTSRFSYHNMLGSSPAMREVFETIDKVRSNSATVLIRGESGTGKELVARAIHASGLRSDKPFVAINCAAIPESLIESELFGHERGAFTGALLAKTGRFEEVEDGTLFLDEIGCMQYDLQSKLLRVIQEREFQRIGGSKMLEFRGRLVAATSEDLEALMRANRFRADLYFRLNVVPIELPPLRRRIEDLPLLASHFLKKYAAELGKNVKAISPEALELLEAWHWPGNVRELENLVQRMVVLADDSCELLDVESVPRSIRFGPGQQAPGTAASPGPTVLTLGTPARRGAETPGAAGEIDAERGAGAGPAGGAGNAAALAAGAAARPDGGFVLPPAGIELAALEESLIRQALERSRGRIEPAARSLGITYKTLQYRIKKYGLQSLQR